MDAVVIAFSGKKDSGKDSCVDFFKEKVEGVRVATSDHRIIGSKYRVETLSFAYPLKRICSYLFNIPIEHFLDRKLKETPLEVYPFETPRVILQKVGTECIRSGYPDAWIQRMLSSVNDIIKTPHKHTFILISDLRFPNEYELVRQMGGYVVRLNRPSLKSTDRHASESYIESMPSDLNILNNGTLDDLKNILFSTLPTLDKRLENIL